MNLDEARAIADRVGAELVPRGRSTLFDVGGELFSFVPGGEVTVGYDGHRFPATPEQVASFAESAEQLGIPGDIREFVDSMTSPLRTVVVPPLLVAVSAVEAGAVEVEPDHPEVRDFVAQVREAGTVPVQAEFSGEARVRLGADGAVLGAWLLCVPTYAVEVERLAAIGQRLLTPDEWEHACGAGATTLFRWGDTCPGGIPWGSDGPHREPNAFGLEIGQDPYRDERTADPRVVCGGDGGSMVCGGCGDFVSWLTLATAFRDAAYAEWLQDNEDDIDLMFVRPAIPLD